MQLQFGFSLIFSRKFGGGSFSFCYKELILISDLRSLILRGELDFTDVGFIKAFKGMESLHELELTGSLLHVCN